MKTLLRLLFLFSLFILTTSEGCKKEKEVSELLPGYSLYDAPNDLDRPGLIFRVTPDGKRYNVGYLNVTPDEGRIEIKSTEQSKVMSMNAIANFLNLDRSKLKAEGNLDLNRKMKLLIKMSDNKQEALSDFSIDSELMNALAIIQKNRAETGRTNDKYYLIRESVLSKNLEYKLDKEVLSNAGFKVALDEVLKGNIGAEWDSDKEFQLKFTYEKPLRVFYKAEHLSILSSATGDTTLRRSKVNGNEIYTSFDR